MQSKDCRNAEQKLGEKSRAEGEEVSPYLTVPLDPAKMRGMAMILVTKGQMDSFTPKTDEWHPHSQLSAGPGGITLQGRPAGKPERISTELPEVALDVRLDGIALNKLALRTEDVSGPAARKHPAYLTAQRLILIMAKGNLKDLCPMLAESERPMFDKLMAPPERAQYLEVTELMAEEALKASNVLVSRRSAVYQVTFEQHSNGDSRGSISFQLVQEGNGLRLAQWRRMAIPRAEPALRRPGTPATPARRTLQSLR